MLMPAAGPVPPLPCSAYCSSSGWPFSGAWAVMKPSALMVTPAGRLSLSGARGAMATLSLRAVRSLARASTLIMAPGAAVMSSSIAIGGCGEPGGVTATRTTAGACLP